ncbi:hypothetical protein BO78DRAFT_422562 [Aspergillus sclerotiicarbonarius CBS 121057]|uniref:Uncharacterized protein n=1 Tax=Aspergillus sclerotiicarbonarius (strain CBS 121057 / IBT 28362) TaxID=1448318 RepID=A0A319DYX7_ASPSB|nr:hypothetical protein BO78DRAFT_422562 [Aspergillus sclerotiicarbonarius CBS 121057]
MLPTPTPHPYSIPFPAHNLSITESFVARLFDEAGIPAFIWAEPAISILGYPAESIFSGWIIPDPHLPHATTLLLQSHFPLCGDIRGCKTHKATSWCPVPDAHFHAAGAGRVNILNLYAKSRLFGSFPDPPLGRPHPRDEYYMVTSDSRIPTAEEFFRGWTVSSRGRQSERLYPVKMLRGGRYVEGVVRLRLRLRGRRVQGGEGEEEEGLVMGEFERWGRELDWLGRMCVDERNGGLGFEDIEEPFRGFVRGRVELGVEEGEGVVGERDELGLEVLRERLMWRDRVLEALGRGVS